MNKLSPGELGSSLEKVCSAFFLFSADGTIFYRNQAADKLLQSIWPNYMETGADSPGNLLIKWFNKKKHPKGTSEENHVSGELYISAAHVKKSWLHADITRIDSNTFFCLVWDISAQKQNEKVLTSEKKRIENKSLVKNRFFANVTHEIRTPIQTILGTMELLRQTQLDQEQSEYVRQVSFSTDVLLSLVNDILDVSKIESGKFHIESIPFQPVTVIEQTIDLLSIEAHEHNLEIIIDIDYCIPAEIIGDPNRLQQILLNLLKNAVKFTQAGYVIIRVAADIKKHSLQFEVIDSGIGVPDEIKKKLFTDFFQAEASVQRKYGGTGLGLSICRSFLTLMHGTIGVRDNPDGGAVFYFNIPYKPVKNTTSALETLHFTPGDQGASSLIVDDNPLSLANMHKKLCVLGMKNIYTANSGSEALELIQQTAAAGNPLTYIFIDMIMPAMDGWRLAAEINSNPGISTLLFLMVPEGQMGGEAKMKLLRWFDGYLYKPVKLEKLAALIDNTSQYAFLEPITEEIPETEPIETPTAPDITILVAEDHPINRKILSTFLTQYGAQVLQAEDGIRAVEAVNEHPQIDMIFMDIQMPVMSGIEATIQLRTKNFSGVIIACTANTEADDFASYKKAGIDDMLVKPFKKQAVYDMIEKWTHQ